MVGTKMPDEEKYKYFAGFFLKGGGPERES
jgi:hypothetical protein